MNKSDKKDQEAGYGGIEAAAYILIWFSIFNLNYSY